MNLVIVESPAKAKTINKYLGSDYTVLASYGHIRDLPSKNGSVDPENSFKMIWEIDSFSKKYLKEITDVANTNIDEVFIGSCMTNIGHYRAAAKVLEGIQNLKAKLWICPPTKMDEETLKAEGYYKIFENCGARLELPGCSLCMGNQARVEEGSVVFSTSTRNFDNRLGKNAQVFLGRAELAAVCALLGKIPAIEEYQDITKNKINPYSDELYRYLQFDEIHDFSLTK